MGVSRGTACLTAVLISGTTVLVVGILLPTVFNRILKDELQTILPLVNGSKTYGSWKNMPVPMLMQVWVFDVVNAEEVMEYGAKAFVVEKGPYTYRLKREKTGITPNNNQTVTYRQRTWYYFDRNMSVGDESDNFTTINNILLGSAYMTRFEYPVIKELVKLVLETLGGRLYETYTVKDMLWGYEDPLLKIVKDDVLGYLNLSSLFDDHFGFYYKMNGSDDGLFTVFTGSCDLSLLNKVDKFNGLGYSPFWSTTYARMINGTDGTLFPPFLNKDKHLYFYNSETCRTLYMEYSKDVTFKDVNTYRYILPASMFESGAVNPNNVGFCTPDIEHCMPSGVLNMSGCRSGSSAVVSYPHFLWSDPDVIKGVNGLNPDPQQHLSYLDLEPTVAIPLDTAMRLQISVYVSRFADIRQLRNTRTYFHPIFWFNETATITDDLANQMRSEFLLLVNMIEVLKYVLPCVGAIAVILAAGCFARRRVKNKTKSDDEETSPITPRDS